MDVLDLFHPLIKRWFLSRFKAPTLPQQHGWPRIVSGEHVLISAPTGSGKTFTAFLAAIDRLVRRALDGTLESSIQIVYVSPLRALSNDMHRNLEVPLQEILAIAESEGLAIPPLRVGLRTGDTSSSKRAAIIKNPPHILVTTPESLYLMLTSLRGRERLQSTETIIVDEIHALVRDKRGSHLSLSLERLQALCPRPVQRIGLSATQRPMQTIGEFLVGRGPAPVEVSIPDATAAEESGLPEVSQFAPFALVDVGHQRDLDLAIGTPNSELGAICTHEQWAEVNQQICDLVNAHRSTIIFCNTRRLTERVTYQLSEILGEEAVSSHHGSLAADLRHDTEQRLKNGQLKAVVATASLELGLDVGYLDLVIQIGSPRSIATFLQRVGRSGHALGLTPKGRLFALTRDELIEAMALIRAIRNGRLDVVRIPRGPLDILAQQIVAEVSSRDYGTDELLALCRRAYPYRHLGEQDFAEVLTYLSEGVLQGNGRGRMYLHHDRVGKRVSARPGARLTACTCGGAIPEIAAYRVVVEPENTVVGSVDEEFAVESAAGDIFLLGNTSWKIVGVRGNDLVVRDAHGAPPSIPFWQGEGLGRTKELSQEVSQLREDLEARVDDIAEATDWLKREVDVNETTAAQAVNYCAAQKAAIGLLPTQKRVVFERFFDESGGMQMVIHAPFGTPITRGWGLAMRKRFCRSFDFELQATADDDGVVLSLGPQHSFPLESMFAMLNPQNIQALLEQAFLYVPVFQTRWRWNVVRSLLVLRMRNGKKVPPAIIRFKADDLLTAVFPKLTGCQENVTGDLEVPDHPLARQSMHDCLYEANDFDGLMAVMESIKRGEVEFVARDTREPSPFSYELLNAAPYAFLDGGEAAERRARAVSTRRSLTVESVSDLGRLDPLAIEQVCREAQPLVRSADELHDVLLTRIALPDSEVQPDWRPLLDLLVSQSRVTCMTRQLPTDEAGAAVVLRQDWVSAERLPAATAAFPGATFAPVITAPAGIRTEWTPEDVRVAMIRGLIEVSGPITTDEVALRVGCTVSAAGAGLEALEGEGVVLRGRFLPLPANGTPADGRPIEWCHRRLLSRIHRLTMEGLRREIEPVTVDLFIRFLTRHHHLLPGTRAAGASGVLEAISQLQGLDAPAVCWERDLLPSRIERYRPELLDELCLTGELGWGRLFPRPRLPDKARAMKGVTRVVPMSIFVRREANWLQAEATQPDATAASSPAQQVYRMLQTEGAMFAGDIQTDARLLPSQVNEILGELVSHGLVTADGFGGLCSLIAEKSKERRESNTRLKSRRLKRPVLSGSGRWSLFRRPAALTTETGAAAPTEPSRDERRETVQKWAWQLLKRWGVVFRDILEREDGVPSWFELLQIYRRLEARGEIRGGRFITGVAGEQFALGDTVKRLRQLRDAGPRQELVIVSSADPLNLVGILTPHPRIPSQAHHRIAYLDGVPVAALVAGELRFLTHPTPELQALIGDGEILKKRLGEPPAAKQKPTESADAAPVERPRRKETLRQRSLFRRE